MKKIILTICAFMTAGIILPSVSFANPSPVCTPSPVAPIIGQEITWTVSDVPTGYTYAWGIDENGNPISADNTPIKNSYATAGTKTFSVIVGNGEAENKIISCSVTVKTALQSAMSLGTISCTPSPVAPIIGQEITWTVSDVPTGYTYAWGIDENGNPISADNTPIKNSYATAGTKTFSVIVGNGEEANQSVSCSTNVIEKKTENGGGFSGGGGGGGSIINSCSAFGNIDNDTKCNVDIFDFNTLVLNWGNINTGNISDLNKDGIVDILDFNILMLNWTGTL